MKSNLNEKEPNWGDSGTEYQLWTFKADFSATSIENSSLNERLFALQRQYLKVRNVLELLKFPPQ